MTAYEKQTVGDFFKWSGITMFVAFWLFITIGHRIDDAIVPPPQWVTIDQTGRRDNEFLAACHGVEITADSNGSYTVAIHGDQTIYGVHHVTVSGMSKDAKQCQQVP
jgi:hypothetical protein